MDIYSERRFPMPIDLAVTDGCTRKGCTVGDDVNVPTRRQHGFNTFPTRSQHVFNTISACFNVTPTTMPTEPRSSILGRPFIQVDSVHGRTAAASACSGTTSPRGPG